MHGFLRRWAASLSPSGEGPLNDHRVLALASLVVGVSLFLPRPTNFAPLGAFGLFVGAYGRTRRSWIYPLAALGLYVVLLGGYHGLVLAAVVLGFAGPAVMGARWLRDSVRPSRVGAGALAASVWFFAVSNFGSWFVFGIPRGETLLQHYALGLPFLRNTLAGDLFFSGVLFGGYALVARARRRVEIAA